MTLSIDSFRPETIYEILQPITENYGGADSRVSHVEKYAVHMYKEHVDEGLYKMYEKATREAQQNLSGKRIKTSNGETIKILVSPILNWFIAPHGAIVSITDWIDGTSGYDLRNDAKRSNYLSILEESNRILNSTGSYLGAEIIPVNTRYHLPWVGEKICHVTDIGNGLRYFRPRTRR